MKASAHELIQLLPGKTTKQWPMGERFITAFQHGSMSVEFYALIDHDPQTPHPQDELYFIHSGQGEMIIAADLAEPTRRERHPCNAGMVFFIPAGIAHHFENFSTDFSTWVVFWGPAGGEGADTQ